jgi:hypothetical protein
MKIKATTIGVLAVGLALLAPNGLAQEAASDFSVLDLPNLSATAIIGDAPEIDRNNTQIVQDTSFEDGTTQFFWFTNTPDYLGGSPIFGVNRNPDFDFARTGEWYVILGSGNPEGGSDVYQDIEVDQAGPAEISFWIVTGINAGSASTLSLQIGDDEVFFIDGEAGAQQYDTFPEYTQVVIPYEFEEAGTTQLLFNQEGEAGAAFINFFIEDVQVNTGVTTANESDALPSVSSVSSVYPNPFQSEASLSLNLVESATVRVTLHDLLGREVARIADGVLPAGQNELRVAGGALVSGIYFVRIETSGQTLTRKVSIVR